MSLSEKIADKVLQTFQTLFRVRCVYRNPVVHDPDLDACPIAFHIHKRNDPLS